jgi:hypothetical protein
MTAAAAATGWDELWFGIKPVALSAAAAAGSSTRAARIIQEYNHLTCKEVRLRHNTIHIRDTSAQSLKHFVTNGAYAGQLGLVVALSPGTTLHMLTCKSPKQMVSSLAAARTMHQRQAVLELEVVKHKNPCGRSPVLDNYKVMHKHGYGTVCAALIVSRANQTASRHLGVKHNRSCHCRSGSRDLLVHKLLARSWRGGGCVAAVLPASHPTPQQGHACSMSSSTRKKCN